MYVSGLEAVQIYSFRSVPISNMAARRPSWIPNEGQKSLFPKYWQVVCQIEDNDENNSDLFILFHADPGGHLVHIKVMEVIVLQTHKQSRIHICMKVGHVSYKTRVK